MDVAETIAPVVRLSAVSVAAPTISPAKEAAALKQKRRLLLIVRLGLSLGVAYLLLFSQGLANAQSFNLTLSAAYLLSNVVIALLPLRLFKSTAFHTAMLLVDTAAISAALFVLPQTGADVYIFYFAIILLAATSDRIIISLLAPVFVSVAYVVYLVARYDVSALTQPALLLRIPFFLLTGAFYGFFVDRTRRGQAIARQATEREKARTEFLSLVTHDLKQPLWVAQQCAGLLYEKLGRRAPDERPLIAQVMVNIRRMESLTLNFLEFARLEGGSVKVVQRAASINQVIADMFDTARPAFELKRLTVRLDLDRNVPLAWMDPLQIERVLTNLLDNAIKYTPEEGLIFAQTSVENGRVTIRMGDSGPGIAADAVPGLFSRFQSGTDTDQRKSTGLGLYIAHAIMLAHDGDLAYDTERQPGAWFVARLPIATAEQKKARVPVAA
jgi:signal transduction histidine kinase